jgi:hypothetical protein
MSQRYNIYVRFWLQVEEGNKDAAVESVKYELAKHFGEEQDYEVSASPLKVAA